MDSKTPLLPQAAEHAVPAEEDSTMRRRVSPKRFSRFHATALAIILALFWLARTWDCHHHEEDEMEAKVPLEVHIMSKCPDARDCLRDLVVPAMANISDKVDFKLSYIGKTTEEDDGVKCMHGQTECLGNIIELCAATSYPSPKIHLGFTLCLSRRYPEIPSQELVEDCALEHGIDFDVLNECMSRENGAYGMGLLRDSVTRSAELGVKTSCTVRLGGKVRCVRDGGEWRDCEGGEDPEDLVRDIKRKVDEEKGWTY